MGLEDTGSLAANAVREAWEELELQLRLIDLPLTFTRYYVGRRVGGGPARMGWESQGSILAPAVRLDKLLNGPHDGPLVAAILAYCG